jgi:energy-coupling factor transporter ATP-binding protein EcfA2
MEVFNFCLKGGSSMLICGPTMAGKSTFVHELLSSNIFDKPTSNVYWYHGGESVEGLEGRGYIIRNGLPDNFLDVPRDSVVVLDDLMNESKDHAGVTALFTKLVHHRNLFVLNITQNFFQNSKDTRTRRLNTQYVVMFKNPSDMTQIHTIGRQMYPGNPTFLSSVNRKATKKPHSYLFLDLRQETPEKYRVRSHILPREFPMRIYKQAAT